MLLSIYQIDAFADRLFAGNPAAVVPVEAWLDDRTLQAIASENNLSETAFILPEGDDFALRWFTPATEVDLCGHATLASAFVVFRHLRPNDDVVRFHTRSGLLTVRRSGSRLTMDFPARPGTPEPVSPEIVSALGIEPRAVLRSRDLLCRIDSAEQVRSLQPDLTRLAQIDCLGVIITAPGDESGVDFVSRFFAPRVGIPEDPVTGSAHCTLIPYWAAELGRTTFVARQLSPRGGTLWCSLNGSRVTIGGEGFEYLQGTIDIPNP